MRIAIFCHSLVSDWNHGNAHFLRGTCTALLDRGHEVLVYEPRESWSLANLRADHGDAPVDAFHAAFPRLRSTAYDFETLDLARALKGVDVVLVHEWNSPELVAAVGQQRRAGADFILLFHDTHHRSATDPAAMGAYDLRHYDGVLAFGESVRLRYLENGWATRVWTWHEAADTSWFYPRTPVEAEPPYDLVWIGNWGDDERAAELQEFLLGPAKDLGLRACVYGVRYPAHALKALRAAGIEYGGWLPNARVPDVFAQARVTVHVPRWPYAHALAGVPTIRMFEALACRIPLISAPWPDSERLFRESEDFVYAADGEEMKELIRATLDDPETALRRAKNGFCTIQSRHTCVHRAVELERICQELM